MRFTPLIALVLSAAPAFAQADRYELGRRLHDFEVTWDKHADDAAAKKLAAPTVAQAVEKYFGFDIPAAARLVDAARHALESADPVPAPVRWADALQALPEKRVVDASVADLTVAVKPFYKADVERPKSVVVRAKIGNGKMVEAPIESLPMTIMVPIKDVPGPTSADLRLVVEILADGNVLASRSIGVARVENLATRVEAIKKAAKSVPN